MANSILHKAATRGHADHGWLKANHTFSFAGYYDPERVHFGALRVLNDDYVEGGQGFGTHPHDNMEIITIPLEGALEHKDSMGNGTVIQQGDIQVMSAGTGIRHSEFNHSKTEPIKLLQIWVFPEKRNVMPRYQQITLDPADRKNKLQQVVSPDQNDDGVWVHQQTWFHLGKFDKGATAAYRLKNKHNGVYAFVISGDFKIDDTMLNKRDGLGTWNTDEIKIEACSADAEILLIEVPMTV